MSSSTIKLLLVLSAGFCTAVAWSASQRAPQLEISPVFDLGELEHDREVDMTVSFRNSGNGILRVDPPVVGCSCSTADISERNVGPGTMGCFRFVLRPAGVPGMDYQTDIVIPSNDPREPRRMIELRGRMRNKLISDPSALSIFDARPGSEWTQQIVLRCTDSAAEFEVVGIDCDLPGVEIDGPHSFGDGEDSAWLVLVSHTPESTGRTDAKLTLRTNHREYSVLEVPIIEDVRSRLSVFPASALLQTSPDAEPQVVTITADQPFRLSIADADVALFKVDLNSESEQRWTLRITPPTDNKLSAIHRSEIRLNVEGIEHESQFAIPVVVLPGAAVAAIHE